jgi:membrane protein DedA with SNARE-associated domain
VNFLHEGAQFIEPYIRHYGLYAIFIIIYLESLGAPLPGESALITASVLAIRGDFAIVSLFLTVWAAAVLGDSTGYLIGHFGGRPLLRRYGWLVKLTPERLEKLEDLFRRRGPIIVFGARFVVVLRQLNGLIAGSVVMPWRKFFLANLSGAALWAAVWSFGPYFLHDLFDAVRG